MNFCLSIYPKFIFRVCVGVFVYMYIYCIYKVAVVDIQIFMYIYDIYVYRLVD